MADEKTTQLTINVMDRPLSITVNESEVDVVREAGQKIAERISELKQSYKVHDNRDYLSMALLMTTVESLKCHENKQAIETTQQMLDELDKKLLGFLEEV